MDFEDFLYGLKFNLVMYNSLLGRLPLVLTGERGLMDNQILILIRQRPSSTGLN